MKRIRKTHKRGIEEEEEEEHDEDYFEAVTPTILLTSRRTKSSRRGEVYEGPMDRRCTTHRKHAKMADTGANTKNGGKKLQRTRDSIDIMPTAPLTSGRTRSFRERGSKDPRGITHEKRGIITRTLSMKAITPKVPPASRRREGRLQGRLQGKTTHTYRGESDGNEKMEGQREGGTPE